jgi:copper(I)-binding protein
MFRHLLVSIAALSLACAAMGGEYRAGPLRIQDPWARPAPEGMVMGVAYFTLANDGETEDALIAASTPAAARVEFHQTTLADGMARMRPLAQISVSPGQTVKVEPGGIHLMLVQLSQSLVAGQQVPLTLEFRNAGKVEIQLRIGNPPAARVDGKM